MTKQRTQAQIALEHFLRNKRLGIVPTRRGEKRLMLDQLLLKYDGKICLDNVVRFKRKRNTKK